MGFFSALATLLDSSAAATSVVAAGLTVCPVMPIPKVHVHLAAQKPYYSEKVSSKSLTEQFFNNPDSTMSRHNGWAVDGTTTSQISYQFYMHFKTRYDKAGNTCLYFDQATFTIAYYPAVFVAKEALSKKCYADVIRAHEMQHVAIDTQSIQEYLPHIKVDMLLYLRSLGYQGFGPMPQAAAKQKQEELKNQIMKATRPMVEKLRIAVRKRQSAIDTPENYAHEQAKCPEDFPHIDFDLMGNSLGWPDPPQAQ